MSSKWGALAHSVYQVPLFSAFTDVLDSVLGFTVQLLAYVGFRACRLGDICGDSRSAMGV